MAALSTLKVFTLCQEKSWIDAIATTMAGTIPGIETTIVETMAGIIPETGTITPETITPETMAGIIPGIEIMAEAGAIPGTGTTTAEAAVADATWASTAPPDPAQAPDASGRQALQDLQKTRIPTPC